MKARAAILVEQRRPLVVEKIDVPALKLGQVLVRVLASGICGSQIGEINGVKGADRFLPHLLGHEGCGEVLEIGEGVTTVKPGDRVVLHWRKGAGLQSVTPVYGSPIGLLNAGWVTTFNDHAIVSENRVTAVPRDLDVEAAALFGCAITTACGVINNNARLAIGESLVVFGAGGIGLSIVQAAALAGANPIVAIDVFDNRLELARSLGATHAINSTTVDVEVEVGKLVGSNRVDVVIDNTGNVDVISLASQLTGSRGRTVLVGVPPKGTAASITTLPLHFGKQLLGSHGGECQPDIDIPRYARMVLDGRMKVDGVIGRRYSLDQVNDAIFDMISGQLAGRAIIRFDRD